MKSGLYKIILFSSLILVLIACHKYPEDPFISLRKPGKRLNGTWQFTSYKINGVDHSHDFDHYISPHSLLDCNIEFKAQTDYASDWLDGTFAINLNPNIFLSPGSYNLYSTGTEKSKNIIIACDTSLGGHIFQDYRLPRSSSSGIWVIKELYGKKLHLNKNSVDIYFTKK